MLYKNLAHVFLNILRQRLRKIYPLLHRPALACQLQAHAAKKSKYFWSDFFNPIFCPIFPAIVLLALLPFQNRRQPLCFHYKGLIVTSILCIFHREAKMLPSSYTATILLIFVSLFLSISAIAACSAHIPIEQGTSIQMPVNTTPPTVSNAQPTCPASPFFFNFIGDTVCNAI